MFYRFCLIDVFMISFFEAWSSITIALVAFIGTMNYILGDGFIIAGVSALTAVVNGYLYKSKLTAISKAESEITVLSKKMQELEKQLDDFNP